jgi:hypothetical protein
MVRRSPAEIFSKSCLQRAIFSMIDSTVAVQMKDLGFVFRYGAAVCGSHLFGNKDTASVSS